MADKKKKNRPQNKNLLPQHEVNTRKTPEERKERASKAGIASGAARRERRTLRETLVKLMDMPIKDGEIRNIQNLAEAKGSNITVQEAMIIAQVAKAIKGNQNAFELLAKISGDLSAFGEPTQPVPTNDTFEKAMKESERLAKKVWDEDSK